MNIKIYKTDTIIGQLKRLVRQLIRTNKKSFRKKKKDQIKGIKQGSDLINQF